MRKSFCGLLTIIFLFAAVLAGCGGSTGESSGKKVLNVALWDENVKEPLTKTIQLYNQNHPDVEVKVTYTPWADYWTKLKTSLAGNSGPDVFWMNGPNFYAYASNGWIKDLQPLVDESKLDASVYTDALINLYSYKDHLYGLPYFLDAVGLYYNKELFDKAGIPYPDDSWTWNSIEENAAKLTNKENGVYGYAALIDSQSGYYDLIHQAGGYIISEDKKKLRFRFP